MKLVTFSVKTPQGQVERLGALSPSGIVDLNRACPELPSDMLAFLALGAPGLSQAAGALVSPRKNAIYPEQEVRLLAPVPRPGALRDFFAFEEHALQSSARRQEKLPPEWYNQPLYFKGNHREIYGPGDTIPWPSYTRKLDFELEIACVVGEKGRDLSIEEAAAHIAGYTIFNDFSARDIQKNEQICRMGPAKGKDFANALGPYLLTADELPDPDNLAMTASVNGEKWSTGNSSGRYWSFPQMLSHVSQEETVYPGDILGSGTYYKGCGLDLDRWIKPGDVLEFEVEKLGLLRSVIGAPKAQKHLKYQGRSSVSHR